MKPQQDTTVFLAYMRPQGARDFFKMVTNTGAAARLVYTLPWSLRKYPEQREVAEKAFATYMSTARPWHWTRLLPRGISIWLLSLRYAGMRRLWDLMPGAVGLCWNGFDRGRYIFAESARRSGNTCIFAELSPLPGFLTLDLQGVNYAGSVPRNADFFLRWSARHPEAAGWRDAGRHLSARPPRKPVASAPPEVPGPFLFVPLQVPGDSQIRYFGDWICSVEGALSAVLAASEHLPAGWTVVIKEHPSSKVRLGHLVDTSRYPRCVLDNATDTFELVRRSSAVLTINSSVGLQSFFFDKPVIVLGHALFGIEPIVRRARSQSELESLLRRADLIDYDARVRDAFMSYLVNAYYFPFKVGAAVLDKEQAARVRMLLLGMRDT